MKQKLSILCLAGVLFVLSTSSGIAQPDRNGAKMAQASPSNVVQIEKLVWAKKSPKGYCEYQVKYPQVIGLSDTRIESKINKHIKEKLLTSDKAIVECDRDNAPDSVKSQEPSVKEEVDYQVTFNAKNILSIEYERMNFFTGSVYGQPARGITVNVKTGKVYGYRDLFKPGSNYASKMNKLIYEKLKASDGKSSDVALSKEESENIANQFKSDSRLSSKNERSNYSFSLHGDKLVILDLFNTHALRAIQAGFKSSEIKNLVNPKGPLQQLQNQ
jgi:hypothetical protein